MVIRRLKVVNNPPCFALCIRPGFGIHANYGGKLSQCGPMRIRIVNVDWRGMVLVAACW